MKEKEFIKILEDNKVLYNYYHKAPTELSKNYIRLYIINNQKLLDAIEKENEDIENDEEYKQNEIKKSVLKKKFGVVEWQWEVDGLCNFLQSIGGKMYKDHCIKMINEIKNQ